LLTVYKHLSARATKKWMKGVIDANDKLKSSVTMKKVEIGISS